MIIHERDTNSVPDYDNLIRINPNSKYPQCKKGFHKWSDRNAYALHNAAQLTEDEKNNGAIFLRICKVCGVEMPDCRKGEDNYIEQK